MRGRRRQPDLGSVPADEAEHRRDAFAVLGLDPAADSGLVDFAYRHHLDSCRRMPDSSAVQQARLSKVTWAMDVLRSAGPPRTERRTPRQPACGLTAYQVLRLHPSADQELITVAYRHGLRGAADDMTVQALECAYARIGTPIARAAYDTAAAAGTAAPEVLGSRIRRGTARTCSAARMILLRWCRRLRSLLCVFIALARAGPSHLRRWLALLHRSPHTHGGTPPWPEARSAQWRPELPIVAWPVGALRILDGEREVQTLLLRDCASYTIGAGSQCDVRLSARDGDLADIAGEHARLTVGNGWVVFQQLAANATSFINGKRAVQELLEPGDTVGIGPYRCQFYIARFEVHQWRVEQWS